MSDTKHTLGPWRWTNMYEARDGSKTWTLMGPDGDGILSCDGLWNSPQRCSPQNAELIRSAPEMHAEIARLREKVRVLADECRQRRHIEQLASYRQVNGTKQEFDDARDAMHAAENRTDAAGILKEPNP